MRSRYSGKAFVRAYWRERQEMFLDAHMRAFTFYGGVFPILIYDFVPRNKIIILCPIQLCGLPLGSCR
jgi:transposase